MRRLRQAAITFAVCELKRALNATLPGSWQAWTTDTGAYFDYKTMTEEGCIDMWLCVSKHCSPPPHPPQRGCFVCRTCGLEGGRDGLPMVIYAIAPSSK